ncbi:VCBS repeat-containing protein [bacterium]|nr:VCBS repeat-containing protein [bacterium]
MRKLLLSLALAFAATFRVAALEPFIDVTAEVGLEIKNTEPVAAWADYDRDGWVDLYACGNLWRNVEGRHFEKAKGGARGPSVLWGDFDNDGYPDALNYRRFILLRN